MGSLKIYNDCSVLQAARDRIRYVFDHFDRVYISFSGGKDSCVLTHLVMEEAIKRDREVGILVIDLEAQYELTIQHVRDMLDTYKDNAKPYWVCLPLKLRNSVSNYEPCWCCWDPEKKEDWVRVLPDHPGVISDPDYFPFFEPWMEFEEFMVLFGAWYAGDSNTVAFIGIRCDESLNRFRTIASKVKCCYKGRRFTTKVIDGLYNAYPIYDWGVSDVWKFHDVYKDKIHNRVYDLMHLAGLTPHQMRLCQPYGDDQKRGLWLYHLIEPNTWGKVVARVNGANSGALYVTESGNVSGYIKTTKPEGHTWRSFCELLLGTMPEVTREHYVERFRVFIKGWKGRGYVDGIPDEAPRCLEVKMWAPSWRRLCRVLLRNDWWCKGLGMTQPKSEAYGKYLEIKRKRLGKSC